MEEAPAVREAAEDMVAVDPLWEADPLWAAEDTDTEVMAATAIAHHPAEVAAWAACCL